MAYKDRPLDHDVPRAQITKPAFAIEAVPECTADCAGATWLGTETTDATDITDKRGAGAARPQLMAPLADLPELEGVSASTC